MPKRLIEREAARPITTRERMVTATYADGWDVFAVGRAFGISPETVRGHVQAVKDKLNFQGLGILDKVGLYEYFHERGNIPQTAFDVRRQREQDKRAAFIAAENSPQRNGEI